MKDTTVMKIGIVGLVLIWITPIALWMLVIFMHHDWFEAPLLLWIGGITTFVVTMAGTLAWERLIDWLLDRIWWDNMWRNPSLELDAAYRRLSLTIHAVKKMITDVNEGRLPTFDDDCRDITEGRADEYLERWRQWLEMRNGSQTPDTRSCLGGGDDNP